ncbi:hypothetical protein CC1G_07478 [Coprinopsis cinerea okayama7|uniref:SnoaL-like domain-containing protein n=1 Tax=Coprinopsis cinerea (strain Okayama-7 / 130 / ATCC MYA-4618 / FGSC 9003) TaxID=240176 RepID=A8NBA8_COPC7|nr:hypothetical protein CC1G_07478 [Coprinopsis cinerea okayama7\|eukprot:XP_001832107.1 hypothetical protein CC1G_07478 [Coprinopsis cinerea okayama7\
MRVSSLLAAIILPLAAVAAPAPELEARQAVVKPRPCVRQLNPPPTAEETAARHAAFAQAFIYRRNITAAFEFIVQDYINHNPMAQNGFDFAWNILSPFWNTQSLTPLRDTYRHPQGWVNYRSGFGEVVDRFRWEGGCIVEHWDAGERYPQ